ncbi:MAG: hypothetical protein MR685_07555 [Alistipes sp.]|jgi:uncharacterized protein (DUF169 family)|nr:hypothetical protein [Alistipes sp.]MDD7712136.1 hypothetical protein [Alistipes sp.]
MIEALMFNIAPVIVKFTLDESILGQKRYRQKKNVEITSTSSVTDRLSSRQDK